MRVYLVSPVYILYVRVSAKVSLRYLNFVERFLRFFNPIQDGLFRGCSRIGGGGKKAPLPKICRTFPTMMKLSTVIPYLKKFQKLYESHNTLLGFC